jgi:hypothetical protein
MQTATNTVTINFPKQERNIHCADLSRADRIQNGVDKLKGTIVRKEIDKM